MSVSAPSGADRLGGGPGVLTALNFDKSVWTSYGADSVSTDPTSTPYPGTSWKQSGSAGGALLIAGSITAQANGGIFSSPIQSPPDVGRFYAVNEDHSLWYDDGLITPDNPGTWIPFPVPAGVSPKEITAYSSNVLYVLDTNGTIWLAETFYSSEVSVTYNSLNLGSGTPLGIATPITFTAHGDGSYSYSGAFHDSGFCPIQVVCVFTLTTHDGSKLVYNDVNGEACGTVPCDDPGYTSRTWGFSFSGHDPEIAQAFGSLNAGWVPQMTCSTYTAPTCD
jgi:hypothetical protein